jgi:hypothetical protein
VNNYSKFLVVITTTLVWSGEGCGDSTAQTDATKIDAPSDARPVDAAVDATISPVRLNANYNGSIVTAATVLFIDNTNTIVATQQTDTQGNASALLPTGGSVVVIVGNPPALQGGPSNVAFVFVGVKPGDQLGLENRLPRPLNTVTKTITIPAASGAANYQVRSSCSNGSTSANLTNDVLVSTDPSCASTGFFVTALDNAFKPLQSFYAAAVATTPATIDLSANVYKSPKLVTVTASNVPNGSRFVNVNGTLNDGKALFSGVTGVAMTPTGTTASGTISVADVGLLVDLGVAYNDTFGFHTFAEQVNNSNLALDFATFHLPVAASPILNRANNTVTWIETANGAAITPNAMVLQLAVGRAATPFTIAVIAPYQTGEIKIPTFAPPYDNLNLRATDSIVNLRVFLENYSGGYGNALHYGMLQQRASGDIKTSISNL